MTRPKKQKEDLALRLHISFPKTGKTSDLYDYIEYQSSIIGVTKQKFIKAAIEVASLSKLKRFLSKD